MKIQFVEAGEIVTTHGVRGEMKILPWLDSPEMLCEFDRVCIAGQEYEVQSCRIQKNCNLLKLAGVDTMEEAQSMRGKIVKLYREDISDDVIFVAELIGFSVFAEGKEIGKIAEVLDYPGNKVYVVKGEKTYMIPAVKAFVLETNKEQETMDVRLIEGMEVDAD